MAVELIEARPGFYFALGREVIEIKEEDYLYLPAMVKDLHGIPITNVRLKGMGFNQDYQTGCCYHAFNGNTVYLKPSTLNRWVLQFEGREKIRYVSFIHEIQDFWFGVFGELLKRNGPEFRPSVIPHAQRSDKFIFVPPRYVFAPRDFVVFELIEANYGHAIPWKGKFWNLAQYIGTPARKFQDEASTWTQLFLVGQEGKK